MEKPSYTYRTTRLLVYIYVSYCHALFSFHWHFWVRFNNQLVQSRVLYHLYSHIFPTLSAHPEKKIIEWMWRFPIKWIPVEICIKMTFFQWSQIVVYLPHWNDLVKPAWAYYFYCKNSLWVVQVNMYSSSQVLCSLPITRCKPYRSNRPVEQPRG